MSPQAPGVTELRSGVLVTDLGHGTGSQPAALSRLFSPRAAPDSLVKGEQVPPHGGIAQVPATGASESAVWLERLGPREWSDGPALDWGGCRGCPGLSLGFQAGW